ncbi:MAG: insulinase family protein [Betaproteobacteria bacterium]|nr:insulinase family protein [Betaproteobacteria bacterium]MDH4323304.1 insulinase family protein [Betaproteobacteria bacterium]MDH5211106.1 insulinase family protein [Betaproteobacteria bacterium]MDH5577975.1 insulinase family protein [Betaproteobacteria bacterium]
MKKLLALLLLALALPGLAAGAPRKVTEVEGVSEYRLDNGLRVLLVPDASADTVTVHMTYLVGSRHEGYGEKGMAHLLEHMLFKGSTKHPDVKQEFARRGARWNGTTSHDRTNYFETLPATGDNLEWALAMEADRMLNSFVRKADLDSEMTVVRNEFEMGENSPGSILFQRMQRLAFAWHNYGHAIIGARSDIEEVPIERLRAFYRTWYQPDNALLVVGGRIEVQRALALVAKHFGPLPRPARALPVLYTTEPVQDGERTVTLHRTGDTPIVATLFRAPAGSHPDFPAVEVLVELMRAAPQGRLHQALVQKGLASAIWGFERALHDPGYVAFGASLPKDGALDAAREALLGTLDGVRREPVRAEEVERARTTLLNEMDKAPLDARELVSALAEFHTLGDWRLFYLYRDRLRAVTVADVQRVAEAYLKPDNRVLGQFVPTAQPQRAQIPGVPDVRAALDGYQGGATLAKGEAFDPSPQNIEARLQRRTLANGVRVALLPKRTRGATVVAKIDLHWGDEQSTRGRSTACTLAGEMLMRGTTRHTRAELRDAFERLKTTVKVSAGGATLETRREHLADALRLVAEVLREPAFPASEFEELKRGALTRAEAQRSDPSAVAGEELRRHLHPYPKGHWHYEQSLEERIAALQSVTLADARDCHRELVGATGADFAAVGDFDPAPLAALVEALLGDWKNPSPYARIAMRYFERPALERELRTPDKANAVLRAGLNMRLRDDDPDFPALVLANQLLGGSSTARLPERIREKEGLSYSTYTWFSASPLDDAANLWISAIFAPENKARVERAVREELQRALGEGFGADEVAAAKKGLLEARYLARTQDSALAERLSRYLYLGRTLAWDVDFEKRVAALTPAEVRDALRRHLQLERLAVTKAGDFKP